MARPLWLVALIRKSFAGRFRLARATHLPLVGALLERWLFAGDDLLVLPGQRTIRIDRAIGEDVVETVLPSRVVEHFIEQARFHWVMDRCICREACSCRDYPVTLGCLFLGEAAAGINPRLGRRVTREEARRHIARCRDAGLVHLVGRNKLDTVWLGVGPIERLMTICSCCPCCCLWRVLPHVSPSIRAKVTRLPGVNVTVTDRCTGCGTCTEEVCFAEAVELVGGRAVIGAGCVGCGRCVGVCPQAAIELTVDRVGVEADVIRRLSRAVDVS